MKLFYRRYDLQKQSPYVLFFAIPLFFLGVPAIFLATVCAMASFVCLLPFVGYMLLFGQPE